MFGKAIFVAGLLTTASAATAATLNQTVHFPGTSAAALYEMYATGAGHQAITGVPAQYLAADGSATDAASVGGSLDAFCFQPDQCALKARILDIADNGNSKTITLSWWNFGWAMALDPAEMSVEGRGAADSIVALTFRDTLRGAQIELTAVVGDWLK